MKLLQAAIVFSTSATTSVAEEYCCWWPQNLSLSDCDAKCQNKDASTSRSVCVSPALWCGSPSTTPPPTPPSPPTPAPAPFPPSGRRAFSDNTTRSAPAFSPTDFEPWPDTQGEIVTAEIDSSILEGEFTKYHLGINVPDYTSRTLLQQKGADLIKEAGFKVLRFPGGSPADSYLWDNSYDKYPFFKQFRGDYDNGIRTDDIIDLCKKTGAEPLIQINYAMFVLYGQEAGADLAVRWYQYFKQNGVTVKYWELGNENSGGWEVPQSSKDCKGFDGPPSQCQSTNGEQYGKDLAYVIEKMKAVDPSVKVGAWLELNERADGAGERKAKWDSLLMPQLRSHAQSAGRADWLNIHSYFWQPMDWSKGQYTPYQPQELYSHDSGMVAQMKSDFDKILQKYFPEGADLPIGLTEWNIDQAFPHADPQVDEHISALVTADIIGQSVGGGQIQALNYFALMDGWKADGSSPGPADLGMITSGQPGVPDGTPRAAWFSFAIWARCMGNQLVRVQTEGDANVVVYASKFASGELGMIVINKANKDVSLTVKGVPANADVRGWMLTAKGAAVNPVDYSAASSLNGRGPASGNVGGPFPIKDIKPYGTRAQGATAQIRVSKVSLVGAVFYPGTDVLSPASILV